MSNWINATLSYLNSRPTQNMYARELVGDIIPHMAISRNGSEFVDTSVIQLTNTFLPVIGGYGLDYLYSFLQKHIQPTTSPLSKKWFIFGKSMALYGFLATVPVANAFIRNWVTAKRTGTDGFIDMIGEKASHSKQSKLQKERRLQQKLKSYAHKIFKLLGSGAVVSAAIFGLTQLAILKQWNFGKVAELANQFLGLHEGRFEFFAKPASKLFGQIALPPILIWGIPIYVGLFSASRDKFEFKELLLRFGTFLTSFFILPQLAKSAMVKHTPAFLKKLLGSAENASVIAELITTSIMFAILPPLVNIFLTKRRVKNEGQQHSIERAAAEQSGPFSLAQRSRLRSPAGFQMFHAEPQKGLQQGFQTS